jgi:hypothetical protein
VLWGALAVAGCGSSTSLLASSSTTTSPTRTAGSTSAGVRAPAPSVCSSSARADVARAASVSADAVSEKPGTSSQATPQCAFRAGSLKVLAIVDSGPQPYFRLERTVVEAQQQFGTVRLEPAPVHIGGLGLDADWFPKEMQIMTTDGDRLITVGVTWHKVPTKRRIALAKVIAHTYLGPLDRKAAYPNGS